MRSLNKGTLLRVTTPFLFFFAELHEWVINEVYEMCFLILGVLLAGRRLRHYCITLKMLPTESGEFSLARKVRNERVMQMDALLGTQKANPYS